MEYGKKNVNLQANRQVASMPPMLKPSTDMRQLLTILMLTACSCGAKAQFFDFGFGDPFGNPFFQERRREPTQPSAFKSKNGDKDINAFIEKNYKTPRDKDGKLNGKIIVTLIVNEKGKVAQAQVSQSVSRPYDEEALRVVKKMKFVPARQGKKKLKAKRNISFPIVRGRLSFSTLKTIDI